MAIRIFKKENLITTAWAGGTTTQLFIFPSDADLNSRNFDFRISTAKIEQEQSKFTPFSGYERKLMVLEGELLIKHKEHHSLVLDRFKQDQFSGNWETIGIGKVIDFNVIYRSEIKIALFDKQLSQKNDQYILTQKNAFVYIFKGSGEIEGATVVEGDFIEMFENNYTVFNALEPVILIVVERKIEE